MEMLNSRVVKNFSRKSELDADGKKSFYDIYTAPDPRPYFEAMQALDYVIPQKAHPMFSRLLQNYRDQTGKNRLRILDLGSSYGINAALLKLDLKISELYRRYTTPLAKELTTTELIQRDRHDFYSKRIEHELDIVGFDISSPALRYAKAAGLIVDAVQANLEKDELTIYQVKQLENIDCIISSGCIGYVTVITLEKIIDAHAPYLPWMAHSVLRMFSVQKLTALLQNKGYEVFIHSKPVKQRCFAPPEEQTQVLSRLHELGIDSSGLEDQGWLYAWLITAVPKGRLK